MVVVTFVTSHRPDSEMLLDKIISNLYLRLKGGQKQTWPCSIFPRPDLPLPCPCHTSLDFSDCHLYSIRNSSDLNYHIETWNSFCLIDNGWKLVDNLHIPRLKTADHWLLIDVMNHIATKSHKNNAPTSYSTSPRKEQHTTWHGTPVPLLLLVLVT